MPVQTESMCVSIPAHEHLPKSIWCLVANVKHGGDPEATSPEGRRGGTKHFPPGGRVYVVTAWWSGAPDGRIPVVGKEKGTRRYVRKVISCVHLEHFRVKRVYSPTVISWIIGQRSWIGNCGCDYGQTCSFIWPDDSDDRLTLEDEAGFLEAKSEELERESVEKRLKLKSASKTLRG